MTCLALPYLSTLNYKRLDLQKQLNIKSMFWLFLQVLSDTFLIPIGIQQDVIINVGRSSDKVSVIVLDFNKT